MERVAFSDRQAYVCAELSRLAYFRFEGGHLIDEMIVAAKSIIGENEKFNLLETQIRTMLAGSTVDSSNSRTVLEKILEAASFKLINTYDKKGTQGFLCQKILDSSCDSDSQPRKILYLVFRGTEPREFEDIKTDIKARLMNVKCDNEILKLHNGYIEALNLVSEDIRVDIDKNSYDQLIVSGHSLGGALALVYTRLYASGVNGACYTFGAPPVGTIDVQNGLKTPVYQIINELDVVPRLPNPTMAYFIILFWKLVRLILKLFTIPARLLAMSSLDEKLEAGMKMMAQYRLSGYVSYLVGAGKKAKLRYNLTAFDRMKLWILMLSRTKLSRFKKLASDHAIEIYVEKLKNHALSRNG